MAAVIDQQEIDLRFDFHPADETTGPKHDQARKICKEAAEKLVELLPEGREKSQAIAALELVMFHANAAIAREPHKAILGHQLGPSS
jgi:hypothetical protein